MKIGIWLPSGVPTSFRVYCDAVTAELAALGASTVPFADPAAAPRHVDVLWDIRSGGGNPPPDALLAPGLPPLVVTVHGFAPMSLPRWEYYRAWRERLAAWNETRLKQSLWRRVRDRIGGAVAVSNFTAGEIAHHAGIAPTRVTVAPHGVDMRAFVPAGRRVGAAPCLLHVSNDEPRKNVARILRAFGELRRVQPAAELVLKLPEDARGRYPHQAGVRAIHGHVPTSELAALYAQATAFVFPSLYEGFGLPILEAMASGCPVITSNGTACAEVAGDDAVCVDPRDTAALAAAMCDLAGSPALAADLSARGPQRAATFTWRRSALLHFEAFEKACAG